MKVSNKGYSLMEIMVVLAIVGLMGLGTTTLVTNMLKLNQKTLMKSNLISVKDMIEKTLRNDQAWLNTICGGNPAACAPAPTVGTLSCLYEQDNVRCTHRDTATGNTFNNLVLYNRNGEMIYDSTANTGWTLDGETCAPWGTDACPFRYTFDIQLLCPPTEDPCLKPDVFITATPAIATTTKNSPANRLDPNHYLISFKRDQEVKYEPLQIEHILSGGNATGDCTDGVRVVRPMNTLTFDVGGNILIDQLATNNRVQLQAGEYDCEVFATGYAATGGFLIELLAGGVYHTVGTGFSDLNSSATVIGTVAISLNAPGWIQVIHTCGPGSDQPYPVNRSYEMGIPIAGAGGGYATSNVLSRVTCVRKR